MTPTPLAAPTSARPDQEPLDRSGIVPRPTGSEPATAIGRTWPIPAAGVPLPCMTGER